MASLRDAAHIVSDPWAEAHGYHLPVAPRRAATKHPRWKAGRFPG